MLLFEGDLKEDVMDKFMSGGQYKWTNGVVPYKIQTGLGKYCLNYKASRFKRVI